MTRILIQSWKNMGAIWLICLIHLEYVDMMKMLIGILCNQFLRIQRLQWMVVVRRNLTVTVVFTKFAQFLCGNWHSYLFEIAYFFTHIISDEWGFSYVNSKKYLLKSSLSCCSKWMVYQWFCNVWMIWETKLIGSS